MFSTAHVGKFLKLRLRRVTFLSLQQGNMVKSVRKPFKETFLGNMFLCKKREPKTHYLHKKQKMRTVPLDVAPERRTKRCSPRFRPGAHFWNHGSHTCRQAMRERSVAPRPYATNPVCPLGSICCNQ